MFGWFFAKIDLGLFLNAPTFLELTISTQFHYDKKTLFNSTHAKQS